MANDNGKIRVLCLHGHGQNSKIFEANTAALRNELGEDFEWHFVEGTIPVPMDPELEGYLPSEDQYFGFMDPNDPQSVSKAMDDLSNYIDLNGPFAFVSGQSGMSSVSASLILRHAQEHPEHKSLFAGAIFFNGYAPFDYAALKRNEISFLDSETYTPMISIPTAHIWGANDKRHVVAADALNKLCVADMKEVCVHNNGSTIPGASAEGDMIKVALAIKRTVSRAIAAY